MKTILHTKEQGLRVHRLAAIAGLENIEAALLLGAFLELAQQFPRLGLQHTAQLRQQGLQKLSQRKQQKITYQQPKKETNLLTETTLQLDDIKKLIIKRGGKVPLLPKDIVPELYRLMR